MNDKYLTVLICSFAILFAIIVKCVPGFYYLKGKHELSKKEYVKAYNDLKKANNLNKNNSEYRYYFVQVLIKLPPNYYVQKSLFEIAYSKKEDSASKIAKSRIYAIKNKLLREYGDNYIGQAPMESGIMRWNVKSFPLKYVVLDQSQTSIPSYYKDEIYRAFSQWQNSVKFVKFEKIRKIQDANIIIKILPLPDNVCEEKQCKYVVGYTTPNYKDKILKNMTIILYAKDPYGNFFSDKELYNTTLHELGHALGIMGHSYSSEDLMYMQDTRTNSIYSKYRSSFQYLSSKDINTINLLYNMAPDITNSGNIDKKGLIYPPIILGTAKEISSRKLVEAQEYIKKAPELASGYIDMGIAYAELNKPKDAIKSMHKAYEYSKNDNEKYLSLYNLAMLYLQINKPDKAQEYADLAQNIFNNEETQELLMKIKMTKRK